MALTPFQAKKIVRVFDMLYDSNQDGVIEKQDFDILLGKISKILEWEAGGDKYVKAQATLATVWQGLREYADVNKDEMITQEEWKMMWGDCLKDIVNDKFPDWQAAYMELMFDVNDKSGDNEIDLEEYTTFLTQFEVSRTDCQVAFDKFSGGVNITRKRFATLWKEYLTSNDETAAGNFLFGPDLN